METDYKKNKELIQNDLGELTSLENLQIQVEIEKQKLMRELLITRKKPLLVRIVSCYMNGLQEWIDWTLENDKIIIQLKKEEHQMETDNESAQNCVDTCDKEDTVSSMMDLMQVCKIPYCNI